MNVAAILCLISELYGQIQNQTEEIAKLATENRRLRMALETKPTDAAPPIAD